MIDVAIEPRSVAATDPETLILAVVDGPDGRTFHEMPTETKNMSWIDRLRMVRITDFGSYQVVFDTNFKLATPAVAFPFGQPKNVTWSQVDFQVTLLVDAEVGGKYPQLVEFLILDASGGTVDPSIAIEPPGTIRNDG